MVILGGGPAGLAVARLLHLRGVRATVLERDSGPDARTQGGSLDLGENGGQRALREMGLADEFAAMARPLGQRLRLMDAQATVLVDRDERRAGSYRPEIDRVQLRRILLNSLPADAVTWSARVDQVTPLPGGRHCIALAGGESVEADLVVGCDGIFSRARPLVTEVRPRYTGITFIHGEVGRPDPDSFLARNTGTGAFFAVGTDKAIMGQRNGGGSIRIHFALRTPLDGGRARGDAIEDPAAVRTRLLNRFSGWHHELLALLDQVDGEYSYWPLYTVPTDQRWAPSAGLTLVGDAAHVMPPFTGEGVNMALLDAVELVDALFDGRYRSTGEAIAGYRDAMLARMAGAIAAASATADLLLSPSGPAALAERLTASA